MVIDVRRFNILLSYLLIALLAIPIFKAPFWGSTYTLVMAGVMGLWLLTAFLYDANAVCSYKIQCQVWLLIIFYLICAFMGFGSARSVIISITTPWCPMIIFLYYVKREDYSGLRTIVKWAFITLVITIFTTVYGLMTNEYLTRVWGGIDVGSKTQYMYQNIGDMGFVYVAGMLLILMIALFPSVKGNRWARTWMIVTMVGCIGLVWLGTSGITLMTVAVSLIVALLYRIENQSVRWTFTAIVIIIAVVLLLSGTFQNLFNWLSDSTNNVYLKEKFLSMAETLSSGESTGDVKARTDLYYQDLELFLNSFGLGVGPYYGGSGAASSTVFVSEHTQLLADLARYGVLFLIYMILLHKQFFEILKDISERCGINYNITPVLICYIMMYSLQPILQQVIIGYFVFLVWPGLPLLLGKWDESQMEVET